MCYRFPDMSKAPLIQLDPGRGGENSLGRIGLVTAVLWMGAGLIVLLVDPGNGNGHDKPGTLPYLLAPYLAIVVPLYLLTTKITSRVGGRMARALIAVGAVFVAIVLAAFEIFAWMVYQMETW